MRADDWPAVKAIYEQGIATRQATFETEAPARIARLEGAWRDTVLLERRAP